MRPNRPGGTMIDAAGRVRLAAGAALALAACSPPERPISDLAPDRAGRVVKDRHDWSNVTADMLVERYGPPDQILTGRLIWHRKGPWKMITVYDDLEHLDRFRGGNNLEQSIVYHVPADKAEALRDFSDNLRVAADGEELSSRSSDEGRNFLALNLADRIVKGGLSPQGARVAYLRALRDADRGKAPPEMRSLLFR